MKGLTMADEFESEFPQEALLGDVPELDESFWNSLLDGAFTAPEGVADELVDTYDPDTDAEQFESDAAAVEPTDEDGIDTSVIDDTATMTDQDSAAVNSDEPTETNSAATSQTEANAQSFSEDDFDVINDPFAIIDQLEELTPDVDSTGSSAGTNTDTDAANPDLPASLDADDVEDPMATEESAEPAQDDHLNPIDTDARFGGATDTATADSFGDADIANDTDFGNF